MSNRPKYRKLARWRLKAVIEAVLAGAPRGLAARCAGITEATLLKYYKASQEWSPGDPVLLRDFAEDYDAAEAKASLIALRSIQNAALAGKWRAGAWWLSRRFPEEFGDKRPAVAVTISGAEGVDLSIVAGLADQLDEVSDDDLNTIEALNSRALAAKAQPVIDITPGGEDDAKHAGENPRPDTESAPE
jgi:hypothetical protein